MEVEMIYDALVGDLFTEEDIADLAKDVGEEVIVDQFHDCGVSAFNAETYGRDVLTTINAIVRRRLSAKHAQ
jgi:hypothetical protein